MAGESSGSEYDAGKGGGGEEYSPMGAYAAPSMPSAPILDFNVPAADFGSYNEPGIEIPAYTPTFDNTIFDSATYTPSPAFDDSIFDSATYTPSPAFDDSIFDSSTYAPSSPTFDAGPIQSPISFDGSSGTFSPAEVDIGASFVPGYGATDVGAIAPSGPGTPPIDYQPPAYAEGPDNSVLPSNATPTTGPAPAAFDWNTLNYSGPAGASGAPNVAALNAAPIGLSPEAANSFASAAPGGGISAAGGGAIGGGAGGAADLSSSDPNRNMPQWSADGERYLGAPEGGSSSTGFAGLPGVGESRSGGSSPSGGKEPSWLDSLGIKNPLGTVIAAGGLINSMLQSRATSKALNSPTTGATPGQSLAELAAPAMQQGREVTTTGVNNAVAGINNLNNAALTNAKTSADLINRGQANVQDAVTDLRTVAQPLTTASQTLLTGTPGGAAGAAATDLAALAAPPTSTASTLQDRGVGLTSYVGTGTLPPSLQAQLDQSKSDARAGLISKYASRGMPTDPARNSSLRMELQDLDRRTIAQGEAMAAELAKTGNTLTGTGLNASQVAGGLQTNRGAIGTTTTGQGVQAATAAGQLAGAAGQLGAGTTGAGINAGQLSGTNMANANTTATSLVNAGISQSGLAANTLTQLAKLDQEQNDRTQKAIAAMAAALSTQSVANAAGNVARTV